MNNIVLPPPTPKDIEAALTAIRNGTSAYANYEYEEAERYLWWVDINSPDGLEDWCGRGITSAEAAAVAWITTCLPAWWEQPGLGDEDYAKVPRHVPDGWQFELYAPPRVLIGDGVVRNPWGWEIWSEAKEIPTGDGKSRR
jgi:hypothetical protein